MRRNRLLFVGEFGCGNFGNDGSLVSAVKQFQEQVPDVEVTVLARDADRAPKMEGVRVLDLAYRPIPGAIGRAIGRLTDPIRYLRHVVGARAVVVPGMGVIEGELGESPLGVPYLLWLTAVLCWLSRTPFALVAVGASPLKDRRSIWFARSASPLASYRSFRDRYSSITAVDGGFGSPEDPVTADVVFALPPVSPGLERSGIGVGVMNFYGRHPDRSPLNPEDVHTRYVGRMVELCRRLIECGHAVVVFAGDESDVPVAERVALELNAVGKFAEVAPERTYVSLVERMRGLHVVAGARYHNLVAAIASGTPAVALGYAEKSQALVRLAGMPGKPHDLDALDVDAVVDDVLDLIARGGALTAAASASASELHDISMREFSLLTGLVKGSASRAGWTRQAEQVMGG